ncbi:MAG TPA: ribbon-helix-helix protein, CopG family [Thermoanaerobaculia bacterium]|nr:ribbon-helix-helix protein, CopG family [Thermoanaerobaculia bacterium]
MRSSAKIAISLPAKTLRSLERARRRLKLNRSEAIQQAVISWLATTEGDPRIAEYIRGYQTHPDDPEETKGFVEAWAKGMEPEDWS